VFFVLRGVGGVSQRQFDGGSAVLRMWSRSMLQSSLVILLPLLASGIGELAATSAAEPARAAIGRDAHPAPAATPSRRGSTGAVSVEIKVFDFDKLGPSAFGDNE
jgi:hypothetical protein